MSNVLGERELGGLCQGCESEQTAAQMSELCESTDGCANIWSETQHAIAQMFGLCEPTGDCANKRARVTNEMALQVADLSFERHVSGGKRVST